LELRVGQGVPELEGLENVEEVEEKGFVENRQQYQLLERLLG
jgi:hypothetical protein